MTKKKKPKITHEKIKPWKAKADQIYSLYVRLEGSDENGDCTCVTCGKKLPWKGTGRLHAGHYIVRQEINTRYDDRNVHPQCETCNSYHEGRKGEYTLFLQKKYGKGIINKLVELSKCGRIWKWFDYKEVFEMYKEKFRYLSQEKEL